MFTAEFEDQPESSFQFPVNVPASDPNAGTMHSCCFSEAYLGLVLGCLQQLLQDTTWDTTDPVALNLAEMRCATLIDMFMTGDDCMPTGMIALYGGSIPPDGWLVCDGSPVSRTAYAALYQTIGDAFGPGDGSTTFNLPDLGGRFPLGVGQQSGATAFALGDNGGEEQHTLTVAELASHTHSTGNSLLVATATPPPLDVLGPNPIPAATGSSGGDTPHNNMPPYLALLPIIRT